MVDVTRIHIDLRTEYDRDYIGHYPSKEHRKGHTKRIIQEEVREERLWDSNDQHRKFGFGEDKILQNEAKEERLRAKEEKHRRMGYERSNGDSVSSSLLSTLSHCVYFTNILFV